jgi:tripartite-type tricarboxylate transporter receptor subunit TctC
MHVPYKGSAQATTAVISGEVQMSLDPVSSSVQNIKAGDAEASRRVGSLALAPAAGRTNARRGWRSPGVEAYTVDRSRGPAGTPADIIARLHRDVVTIMKMPEMRERMAAMGSEIVDMSPQQFQAFIRSEAQKWGDIARRVGAKAE